jgi:signal transduction histidine kinase
VHAAVKEALVNVVKHASASSVLVTITYADDAVDVVVQVDGIGASERVLREGIEGHFGIRNMRRHAITLSTITRSLAPDCERSSSPTSTSKSSGRRIRPNGSKSSSRWQGQMSCCSTPVCRA